MVGKCRICNSNITPLLISVSNAVWIVCLGKMFVLSIYSVKTSLHMRMLFTEQTCLLTTSNIIGSMSDIRNMKIADFKSLTIPLPVVKILFTLFHLQSRKLICFGALRGEIISWVLQAPTRGWLWILLLQKCHVCWFASGSTKRQGQVYVDWLAY